MSTCFGVEMLLRASWRVSTKLAFCVFSLDDGRFSFAVALSINGIGHEGRKSDDIARDSTCEGFFVCVLQGGHRVRVASVSCVEESLREFDTGDVGVGTVVSGEVGSSLYGTSCVGTLTHARKIIRQEWCYS